MTTRSLGQLTLDLIARTGNFTGPLDRAGRKAKRTMADMEADAQAASAGIAAIAGAASVAGAGIIALTNSAAQNAKELQKQAQLANTGIEEFQRLSYATKSVGIEQDKLSNILKDVSDRVGDFITTGGGEMADWFEQIGPRIGMTADDFRNLSGPQALQAFYNGLEKANLSQSEMTFYMESLADEATALIPLLKNGGAGFAEMSREADKLGIVLSEVQVESLDNLANQFDRVTGAASALGSVAAAELAPAMSDLAEGLIEVASAFQDGDYESQIETLANITTVAGTAAAAYGAYRAAIAAATIAQWAFNAAAAANPWGVLAIAIGAATGAVLAFSDEVSLASGEAYQASLDVDGLADAFEGLTEAQQENKRASLVSDLIDMRMEAAKLGAELSEVSSLVKSSGQLSEHGGAMPIASPEDVARGRELRAELGKVLAEIDAGTELLTEYDAVMESVGGSTEEAAKRTRESSEETAKLKKAYSSLLDELYPVEASQRRFREEMGLLDLAAAAGQVENLAEAQQRLRESYMSGQDWQSAYSFNGDGESQEGDYWTQWLEGAEQAFTDFDQLAANTAESFQRGFGNAFESMIFDSQNFGDAMYNLMDGIARSLVSALGEMAAQWLAYQAVQMLVGQTTQSSAAATQTANAMAMTQMAALNAFASTAAIPIVGPAMAPAAATAALAATTPYATAVSALSMAGMAHDGIDSVPTEGTWLLDKGERVLKSPQADKLDAFLAQQQGGGGGGDGGIEINIQNNGQPMQVQSARERREGDRRILDVVTASVSNDGQIDKAIRGKYGLKPKGS